MDNGKDSNLQVPESLPQINVPDMMQENKRKICSTNVRRPLTRQNAIRDLWETPVTKKQCSRQGNRSFNPVLMNISPRTLRKNGIRRSFSVRTKTVTKEECHHRRASVSAIDAERLQKGKEVNCGRERRKRNSNSAETNLLRKQLVETYARENEPTTCKRKREDPLVWKSFKIFPEPADGLKKDGPRRSPKLDETRTGVAQTQELERAVTKNAPARFPRRHLCVISRQQKEETEIIEMKRFRFHAKPLNPKIYIRTKPSKVQGQDLAGKKNAQSGKCMRKFSSRKSEEPEIFVFKANPVPEKILHCPNRMKPVVKFPLTCPRSPAFALRKRESPWKRLLEIMEAKEVQRKEEAAHKKRAPHAPVAPCPKLQPTIPNPFHFEESDKERQARKEMKIKEILEQERLMHEFHANPMPSPTPYGIPEKHPIPGTEPVPFCLQVDLRGEKYQQQLEQQIQEEEAIAKNLANFRANPCTVTADKPFQVEGSKKPLTEFVEIKLATEIRAVRRALFDDCMNQENIVRQDILKVRLEKEQEQEELELQRRRAETIHKAQPMPSYKAPVIVPSSKPLTKPQPPNFCKF